MVLSDHEFEHFICDKLRDRVVNCTSGKDDFRVVAKWFGLVREVVRIDGNAMSSDESGTIFEEVPLGSSGFDNIVGVDSYAVADECELVHKGDIHVALAILYGFCCLCHFHVGRTMGTVFEDGVVERIDDIGYFGRGTGSDFLDFGECVDFVTRVDSFRAIAAEEVLVELESAVFLEHGDAIFLCAARINGWLIDDDVAFVERFSDGLAGFEKRREVGIVESVDWSRDGNDVGVDLLEFFRVGSERKSDFTGSFE